MMDGVASFQAILGNDCLLSCTLHNDVALLLILHALLSVGYVDCVGSYLVLNNNNLGGAIPSSLALATNLT